MQVTGSAAEQPCETCALRLGLGPFRNCIVSDFCGNGACANCHYNNEGRRRPFRGGTRKQYKGKLRDSDEKESLKKGLLARKPSKQWPQRFLQRADPSCVERKASPPKAVASKRICESLTSLSSYTSSRLVWILTKLNYPSCCSHPPCSFIPHSSKSRPLPLSPHSPLHHCY